MKNCNQCEVLIINGVFCHETGCPNQHKNWDEETQTWHSVYECDICGYEVKEDETCTCYQENDNIPSLYYNN